MIVNANSSFLKVETCIARSLTNTM